MKTYHLKNKEINCVDNWDNCPMGMYIELQKNQEWLQGVVKDKNLQVEMKFPDVPNLSEEEQKALDAQRLTFDDELSEDIMLEHLHNIISIVSRTPKKDLYSLDAKDLIMIAEDLKFINTPPHYQTQDWFILEGTRYMFRPIGDTLPLGERKFIKDAMKMANGDQNLYLPSMIAVLVRPAEKMITTKIDDKGDEIPEITWKQAEFEDFDTVEGVAAIEARKQLFYNFLPITHFRDVPQDFFPTSAE